MLRGDGEVSFREICNGDVLDKADGAPTGADAEAAFVLAVDDGIDAVVAPDGEDGGCLADVLDLYASSRFFFEDVAPI